MKEEIEKYGCTLTYPNQPKKMSYGLESGFKLGREEIKKNFPEMTLLTKTYKNNQGQNCYKGAYDLSSEVKSQEEDLLGRKRLLIW